MFVKNGKATELTLNMLTILGILIMILSILFIELEWVKILIASIGLAIGSAGGYLSKTQSWGTKPFDNSYKKAKDSYEKEDKK